LYWEVVMEKRGVRFVGFDTAQEQHEVVLLDSEGEEESWLKCRNQRKAIEDVFGKLLVRLGSGERLIVVLEAPRAHGRLVFEVATSLGCTVVQVSPVALNHYRECEGQPRKDDHWDAFLAGRMAFLRMRGCRVVSDPRPEERVLCRLTRARAKLQQQRVAAMNQLRAIMLEVAPIVLDRQWAGPKIDSAVMRRILKRYPVFAGLERARRSTLLGILKACRCRLKTREAAVDALLKIPEEVLIPDDELAVVSTEIEIIIQQTELAESAISKLERQIRSLVNEHPICIRLMEMPGVGPVTAAVLVGELLPVMRNVSEPSSATYSGLSPLARKSGTSLDRARLGRGSNKHVLNAFFLSSVQAIQWSALDRAYYDKKRADYSHHPRPHTAATIALARQRHKVIYKIMTTDARYDKETLIAAHLNRQKSAAAAA
jgi:transposase